MCAEFSAIHPNRIEVIKSKDRGLMQPDEFDDHIVSLLNGALSVHCSGFGESTIHPQFRSIIKFLSSFDVMIRFSTNGQELNGEFAEFLVEQGVHRVTVSCSGASKEAYEKVYIGGNFDILLKGLKYLKDAKQAKGTRYPMVGINSLGFRHHVESFDTFVELMANHGADVIWLKTLQADDEIPELYEHISIMRPWLEGEVLKRAAEIGARHGVIVDVTQYIHNAVETEYAYREIVERLAEHASSQLTFAKFGDNTIDTFANISRTPKPIGNGAQIYRPIIHSDCTLDEARFMLGIKELDESRSGDDMFYCMEPFKTIFVTKSSELRACCFSSSTHPFLGSLKLEDGLESWRGPAFKAVQEGILDGKYPEDMCRNCLRLRIGPSDHDASSMVREYLDWYADRFAFDLSASMQQAMPDAIQLIQQSPAKSIVSRFKKLGQAPTVLMDAEEQLEIILSTCKQGVEVGGTPGDFLEGWFERIVDRTAIGWVWSLRFPDLRLPIRIWHNAELIAEGVANHRRDDLRHAGKGDGNHGFFISLPQHDWDWSKQDITVTIGREPGSLKLKRLREGFFVNSPELVTGCLKKFKSFDISQEQIELYSSIVSTKKPYIIYFTPRSGSSYLADLMTQTKSLGMLEEFFNPRLMDLALHSMSTSGYIGKTIIDYLNWLMQRLSSANGTFGFKVDYFDFQPLITSGLDKLLFGGFKSIFLYRKNILKQAVSLYVATETSLWHTNIAVSKETKELAESLPYDQEKIRHWIRHVWQMENACKTYLTRQKGKCLELDYDQVSSDPGQVLGLIAQHLDIRLSEDLAVGKSVFQKVRSQNNDELIARFLGDKANREFLLGLGLEENRQIGE